jgi:hypothetical protein
MAGESADLRLEAVPLTATRADATDEAWFLRVSDFPAAEPEREVVKSFVGRFVSTLAKEYGLSSEVFIQFAGLKRPCSETFSTHAREWMPATGLGVWPDREPPRLWTKEDFFDLEPGQLPKPIMYKVFRVKPCTDAPELMAGSGTVLHIMIQDGPEGFFKRAMDLLLPPIQQRAFRGFRFYIPLLERKSVEGAKPEQLESWFCGASAYIRESIEDKGILIASRQPLSPILEELGGKFEKEPERAWKMPL